MKIILSWKFSVFVEKEDHLSVLATRHDACSRPCWWGSCTNDTQWWYMQCLLGKVEGPRSKESTKRKTTRNIWPFYKLSSSFQTPSGSLQDWFEALTKDSHGSPSLWWIFRQRRLCLPKTLKKNAVRSVPSNFGPPCGSYLPTWLLFCFIYLPGKV